MLTFIVNIHVYTGVKKCFRKRVRGRTFCSLVGVRSIDVHVHCSVLHHHHQCYIIIFLGGISCCFSFAPKICQKFRSHDEQSFMTPESIVQTKCQKFLVRKNIHMRPSLPIRVKNKPSEIQYIYIKEAVSEAGHLLFVVCGGPVRHSTSFQMLGIRQANFGVLQVNTYFLSPDIPNTLELMTYMHA